MNILRAFNPWLYDLIQPYAVRDEALMPEEYRYPNGRWKHDDWAIGKSVRRIDCAYRLPLPFRIKSGNKHYDWMLFDPSYPLAPGHQTKIENGLMYVLTERGGYGLVTYEAYIPHLDKWVVVFRKYTKAWDILGTRKRLSWYWGLHQDNHVSPPTAERGIRSDLMCWFPEVACSFIKEV